jgi:hypothetical protein
MRKASLCFALAWPFVPLVGILAAHVFGVEDRVLRRWLDGLFLACFLAVPLLGWVLVTYMPSGWPPESRWAGGCLLAGVITAAEAIIAFWHIAP